jgi:hypothetical protein
MPGVSLENQSFSSKLYSVGRPIWPRSELALWGGGFCANSPVADYRLSAERGFARLRRMLERLLTSRFAEKLTKPLDHRLFVLQPAFPENGYRPSKFGKRRLRRRVPSRVSHYLFVPVGAVLSRDAHTLTAVMSMPKTSVHEDDFSVPSEDDIGFSRQILPTNSEPETQPMGHASDQQLRHRVTALDRTHNAAAGFRCLCHLRIQPWTFRMSLDYLLPSGYRSMISMEIV